MLYNTAEMSRSICPYWTILLFFYIKAALKDESGPSIALIPNPANDFKINPVAGITL
jgi:hypothetical protein